MAEYLRVFCHVGFFWLSENARNVSKVCNSISSRRIAKMLVLSRKKGESIVIDGDS